MGLLAGFAAGLATGFTGTGSAVLTTDCGSWAIGVACGAEKVGAGGTASVGAALSCVGAAGTLALPIGNMPVKAAMPATENTVTATAAVATSGWMRVVAVAAVGVAVFMCVLAEGGLRRV
jgi:hypothetical protein